VCPHEFFPSRIFQRIENMNGQVKPLTFARATVLDKVFLGGDAATSIDFKKKEAENLIQLGTL